MIVRKKKGVVQQKFVEYAECSLKEKVREQWEGLQGEKGKDDATKGWKCRSE